MVAHASELHGHELHAEGHGGGPKRSVWLRGSWVRAVWVSALMGLGAAGAVMLIRHLSGRVAYSDGVVQTFLLAVRRARLHRSGSAASTTGGAT